MPQQIITSRGTYECQFAWAPTFDGACTLQFTDSRPLPAVAAEFDGLDEVIHRDEDGREKHFTGYRVLTMIQRTGRNRVLLKLGTE